MLKAPELSFCYERISLTPHMSLSALLEQPACAQVQSMSVSAADSMEGVTFERELFEQHLTARLGRTLLSAPSASSTQALLVANRNILPHGAVKYTSTLVEFVLLILASDALRAAHFSIQRFTCCVLVRASDVEVVLARCRDYVCCGRAECGQRARRQQVDITAWVLDGISFLQNPDARYSIFC